MALRCSARALNSTSQMSAVHKGVAFEERSLRLLQEHLSMSLRRVGGKSDGGVDLQGWWWLPSSSSALSKDNGPQLYRRRIRVLAQCKSERTKMSPNYVREMEGVLHRYVVATQPEPLSTEDGTEDAHTPHEPIVALLISSSPFSKAALLRAHSSPIPFVLLHIPPLPQTDEKDVQTGDGILPNEHSSTPDEFGSMVFNPSLSRSTGFLGGEIEPRWERMPEAGGIGRPGLWWKGKRIPSWVPPPE